jgi:hypothetical protein
VTQNYNNKSYDIEHINEARRLSDLKEINLKQRVCLSCEEKFNSEGSHNRLCDSCRRKIK